MLGIVANETASNLIKQWRFHALSQYVILKIQLHCKLIKYNLLMKLRSTKLDSTCQNK